MPTNDNGDHRHDSKIVMSERHALGQRFVTTACSECGQVHAERKARPGETVTAAAG